MKTDQSQNRIGNAFLVFSLLFGIGIALSMTARYFGEASEHGYADGYAGY